MTCRVALRRAGKPYTESCKPQKEGAFRCGSSFVIYGIQYSLFSYLRHQVYLLTALRCAVMPLRMDCR